MDRRTVLGCLSGAALAGLASPLIHDRAARAAPTPSSRPRFYLQIIPQGGMDPIYTTDPKVAREVETGIDVPFPARDIVETDGGRLGPSFKRLARWMPRLAIVNAFRQNSANHLSGLAHIMRCKSSAKAGMPTLLELLGARRSPREATAAINIGTVMTSAFSNAFLGSPSKMTFGERPGLFEHLDRAEHDALVDAAKALRREAAALAGARATNAERVAADNMMQSAALFEAVTRSPRFVATDWKLDLEPSYRNGRDLQRALWLFENGLTRCVTVCVGDQDFDTHLRNTTDQPVLTAYLAGLLDELFTELDRRVVDGKTLAEQVLVVVGSEIGRFPRLNASDGKDHFAQAPQLFYGPWLRTGTIYGATDQRMTAVPISLASGRPQAGGHLLRVDDIGTTLLALDGANPELFGYTGEHMRFLRS